MRHFQTGRTTADPHIFNMGTQIFGHISAEAETNNDVPQNEVVDEDGSDNDDDGSSVSSLLTALTSVTVGESPWRSAPLYPPLYLSTVGEYLPPQADSKALREIQTSELGADERKNKDMNWATETYENSLETDHVFERFTKRIGYEGEQCVRSAMKSAILFANLIILY